MGVDLTLLPISGDDEFEDGLARAESMLHLDRDRALLDAIDALPKHAGPPALRSYLAEIPASASGLDDAVCCDGSISVDGYDEPLSHVLAADFDLLRSSLDEAAWHAMSRRNLAALAYISKLRGESKIVLYWG